MEPKGRVIGFRSIYCKRSPSGSLARARYIHQAYRGYTIDLDPTLAAHARTRTHRGYFVWSPVKKKRHANPPLGPGDENSVRAAGKAPCADTHARLQRTQREGKALSGGSLRAGRLIVSPQQEGHEYQAPV